MVTVGIATDEPSAVERVTDLSAVLASLDAGDLAGAGIDIPIGLPETGPRQCDVEARRKIGSRRSSVFPAPLRGLLGTTTYEDATQQCRALSGQGLSRQAYGILAKVHEVDQLMTPERQRHLVEVHPEVSFAALSGAPMGHYKKTTVGRDERLGALCEVFVDVDAHAHAKIEGAGTDDVLDAFAVAWSARRWLARTHLQLGGDTDSRDLRMEIIA